MKATKPYRNHKKYQPAKEEERFLLVVNGEQVWTERDGQAFEVICPTEEWAEDLAKIAIAWRNTGLAIPVVLRRLGFKPCR